MLDLGDPPQMFDSRPAITSHRVYGLLNIVTVGRELLVKVLVAEIENLCDLSQIASQPENAGLEYPP